MTAAHSDPTLPRPDVVRAAQRLPRLYVLAKASLRKDGGPVGRRVGSWESAILINESVHDLLVRAEWATLQLDGRFRLVLGYSQPWGRLHDGCPWCGCWSLFHNAERQQIRCTNPECADPDGRPPTWRGRAGYLELAALLAAAEMTTEQGESA